MLARVREALFSTLGPGIGDSYVLDLFAGSGSLGLEALSRGAAFARLVESDRAVLDTLSTNVAALGLEEVAEVSGGDATDPRSWVAPPGQEERWADLVLFDPPYPWLKDERRGTLLDAVSQLVGGVLRPAGMLVFHAPHRVLREIEFDSAYDPDPRRYGTSALWYLRAPAADQEPPPYSS
jgi:16S rRNA (guanine966-N2)-methyltransferase